MLFQGGMSYNKNVNCFTILFNLSLLKIDLSNVTLIENTFDSGFVKPNTIFALKM